ncbi:MAG: valine--tRNA ligase [Christensenellaceae bacterium]|nr:valine--tRNA ligase [Christensenellaceae bacterium]
MEMDKVFSPQEAEARLYADWESKGYFTPERVPGKKPFVIMMPPPNITGQLHMGHAMDELPQDVLARYHRMKGEPTLWLPGTDHASIATEVKIIDSLKAEGLTKQMLGREKFLERAWQWRDQYGGRIVAQLRKLGASCDWTRERFTMDEGLNKAVVEVFVRLYEKGLIYRGNRIINWCTTCKTALSDAEVEYEEQDSSLWYIRYPGAKGDVVVATTRPETMLGDTGVAVNPNDERYRHLVGATVTLPIVGREIPVVFDEYVDLEFGTGAVKMTPAHDPNDFEVGRRHNLNVLRVLNDDGTMNEHAGAFAGMTRLECREKLLELLEAGGYLVKVEPLKHNVGACYRCHDTVEPLTSDQWFVKMAPLAKPAADAARTGELKFIPERFTKTYLNWMDNIRDWCISRQLWWGHRIPAYYCDCGEMVVARTAPDCCPKCGAAMRQDEDVLDTWFSSALWPFSTLGWPDDTEDLTYFFPTSVMCSGYDILFFWDARMIFSGIEQMGRLPFDTVLLHGLVRDAQGRKMSKSLGNGIDPLEVIEKYGCDALRFSLAMGVSPGSDVRFSDEKVEGFRNFANKVWNASRFALMNLEGTPAPIESIDPARFDLSDRWILTRYQQAVREVSLNLDGYELGLAAGKIYDFAWSSLCDWYIELIKQRLNGEDAQARATAQAVLYHVLMGVLKLLHPFMPFLTDEVYRHLPQSEGAPESIMIAPWPEVCAALDFEDDAVKMEGIMEVVRAVRNLRAEMNVSPGKRATLILRAREGWAEALSGAEIWFRRLAGASELRLIAASDASPDKAASAATAACELFVPLGELVDLDKELARLAKDRQAMEKEIARATGMLANEGFLKKAPPVLVETEREKLEANRQVLESLKARMDELEGMR